MTALDLGLSLMNTFDKDLLKKSGMLGNPRLIIAHPEGPAQGKLDID
jgi:hypothetical protein